MSIEPIEYRKVRDEWRRHSTENAKVKVAQKHFEAIGIDAETVDSAVGVPGNWSL